MANNLRFIQNQFQPILRIPACTNFWNLAATLGSVKAYLTDISEGFSYSFLINDMKTGSFIIAWTSGSFIP